MNQTGMAHNAEKDAPETWGNGCECWVTPERMWTTHYGAVEPGSQIEYNPDCPERGSPIPPGATACERCLRVGCRGECASVIPPEKKL